MLCVALHLDALVLDFESVVGKNVGITDRSALDPLFLCIDVF